MRKLILFISILFVSAIMYGQTDVVRNYTKPYFVKNVKVNDTLGTKRLIVTYGAGLNKILASDAVGMATWVTATSIVPADTFYFDYCNGCAGVVGWKHIGDTIYADTSVLATTFRLDSLTSSVYDSLSAHRVILNYYINDSANLVHWSDTSVVATKYDLDTMKYFPQLFTDSLGGYLNCIDIAYIHQIIGCSPVDFPTGITTSNIGTSSNYTDTAYISKAYITDMSVSKIDMPLVTTPDTIVCWEGGSLKYSLVSDITGITMYNQIGDYTARSDSGYYDYINVNTMVANNTLDINSLEIHPTIGTITDRSPAGHFDSLYVYDTASLTYADIQYLHVEDSLIYTNGAGVGKVLTSDVNGFGTWQAPTNELLTFDVTIPHDSILIMYTRPQELIAAPGANKLIVPISIVGYYYYNGVPYATNTDCHFRFGNSTDYPDDSGAYIFLNIAENIIKVNTLGLNTIYNQQSSKWFDKNLNITVNSSNPTGGTAGNYIRIKGKYYIEDFY